jgi:hypothetical protein
MVSWKAVWILQAQLRFAFRDPLILLSGAPGAGKTGVIEYRAKILVLLRYKRFGPQKGQQGSCRTSAVAMAIRIVAIETGL